MACGGIASDTWLAVFFFGLKSFNKDFGLPILWMFQSDPRSKGNFQRFFPTNETGSDDSQSFFRKCQDFGLQLLTFPSLMYVSVDQSALCRFPIQVLGFR